MIATVYDTHVFVEVDCLISRKTKLANQSTIPDMAAYAEEWNKLAADFEACGLLSNAADCLARYEQYRQIDPGAYLRLIEPPFAEIIPDYEMTEEEARFYTDWLV